jgi:hypothetical protein
MLRRGTLGAVVVASAAGAWCLFSAGDATALENQHKIGVDIGASVLKIDNKSTLDVGGGLGLHYSYGVNDQFDFLAEAASSLVAIGQSDDDSTVLYTRPGGVSNVGAGVGYVIDILSWVPYLCALGEGYAMTGGTVQGTKLLGGVALGLGVDYKVTRHFNLGVAYRQHMMLTDLSTYPSFSNFFARAEYVWGW